MPKRHDIAVQHSSKRSDWRTPPELFGALSREFIFDLDVASDADHVGIEKAWGSSGDTDQYYLGPGSAIAEDALAVAWHTLELPTAAHGDPICFMNPPYSRGDSKASPPIPAEPIEPWIEKAWSESKQGCTVVGVLPFSPQTAWYRYYVWGHDRECGGWWSGHAAMEVRQLPHRVTFIDPDTNEPAANAPGNTCIVIWKPSPGYVGPWQPTVRYWSYR